MFSRPGKSSTSKFRILQERDAIVMKKFRLKQPEKPSFEYNKPPVDEINVLATSEQVKVEKLRISKLKKSKIYKRTHSGNFIFKVQSRNDYYEANVSYN